MRRVKSFSVDDKKEKEILERLDNCGNISDYVKRLILEDIRKDEEVFSEDQKEAIKKILSEMLKGKIVNGNEVDNEVDEYEEDVNDLINDEDAMQAIEDMVF